MTQSKFLENEEETLLMGAALARATFKNEDDASNPNFRFDLLDQSTFAINDQNGVETLGGIIHLEGDLGAGKTTFARGFMRGYGIRGAIKSPTYTIVEPYELELCQLYHFDLYRLGQAEEMEYLGFDDYFDERNICLVEWPSQGKEYLSNPDILIQLTPVGTGRELRCLNFTEKGEKIAQRLWA